jgi:hypothetical protein
MPFIIGMLWGAFSLILKSLVGRVLIALGISYLTYQGVDLLLTSIKTSAMANLSDVPPEFFGIIGLARIPQSINVICSALVAKYTMQGLTGSLTKMVVK